MENVKIGKSIIGPGRPVYVVAELSANHHQKYDEAVELVRAAKQAGADAVKIQTYTPDTLTIDCDNEYFRIGKGTVWEGRRLYELYGETYTPWDWQPKLKKAAEEFGLDLFSTPFDATSVDFLEKMGVPAYKIASFELVDLPLIRKVVSTGKPVILSTGMASFEEIEDAVRIARHGGAGKLVLLKCTSGYPAVPDEMNLETIRDMREKFDAPVGLSDHTLDIAVPVCAVGMGACMIEKHLTLSRAAGGPDSGFSLVPAEFAEMVRAVRVAGRAVGAVKYGPGEREEASRIFRRSIFVVRDVKAGEVLNEQNVRVIRPGHGLAPKHLPDVLGRTAAADIKRGTPLSWDLIGPGKQTEK
ncbi:MAG: pseudaminic acid synthase [Planctomycetes bacterium]|nr:pseudaminic acid synthase [Planctomycetota bacterium]